MTRLTLAALAVLALAACATPRTELHGQDAFDRWVFTHTTTVHLSGTGGNVGSAWIARTRTIVIDDDQINEFDAADPGLGKWTVRHEQAHAVALHLGLMIGDEPCRGIPYYCPPAERAAQCVVEVYEGHGGYSWEDNEPGAWDCTAEWVERTRAAMRDGGVW